MKSSTIFLLIFIVTFTTSCVYKTPVQQGNILVQKNVDEVKPGMSKRQVAIILGTPAIADPFNQDRWDYVSTFKIDGNIDEIKRLTLFFKEDKLVRTEGNYFPESNINLTDVE